MTEAVSDPAQMRAPAMRYLYPYRKRMEILSATFAGGFGVHIWAAAFYSEPLWWAGFHNGAALVFGQAMTIAAMIHALGVRINGRWRWSPAMRLTGMAVHTVLFGYLAVQGFGQTADYTYAWGTGLLAFGASSAFRDVRSAWGSDGG